MRRLLVAVTVIAAVAGIGYLIAHPLIYEVVEEITLPLKHEDIIRQQAKDKDVDADLIAAVIYTESKFRDATSAAGARGMMQILPSTADFIAERSGGKNFTTRDLSTPQVNISYGTYYLRYLLDRYGGNEMLAVAAYNGGETNLDRWLADATREGKQLTVERIPFPETRNYVERVFAAKRAYREQYADELDI